MLVVNFFGSPGCGKSTQAAKLFSKLKQSGINVELVTEVAKDAVWEENWTALKNQLYITGCQDFRLSRLEGKVDCVITDSPILLGIIYNHNPALDESFNETLVKLFNSYNNFNIFLTRNFEYNEIGRNESAKESDILSFEILNMLNKYKISKVLKDNDEQNIYSAVIKELKQNG